MNLSKKQIDIIRSCTPAKLKGKQLSLCKTLGYCTPYGANWSYEAGFIEYKGQYVLVVKQFGAII